MNDSPVQARIAVSATRSQVIPVVFALIGAGFCLFGFDHVTDGNNRGWWPVGLGVAAMLASGYFWICARRDSEWADAIPTNIQMRNNNLVLSTDPRLIADKSALENLAALCQVLTYQRKLPEPDGLVDNNCEPVPETKDAAVERAKKINLLVEEIHAAFQFKPQVTETVQLTQVESPEPGTSTDQLGNFIGSKE